MKKVPSGPVTLSGLDVSNYSGYVDWKRVKESGRMFAFAKCTEYSVDRTFVVNRLGAKKAGLYFAGYHFFHPSRNPTEQALEFLNLAAPEEGELPPMLDWESTDDVPQLADRLAALKWLEIVEKQCGKPPIIYGSSYFLQALSLDSMFERYPLFVAHYGTTAPLVPEPWNTWTFWQYTDKGDDATGNADLDLFNGSVDDLKKLLL